VSVGYFDAGYSFRFIANTCSQRGNAFSYEPIACKIALKLLMLAARSECPSDTSTPGKASASSPALAHSGTTLLIRTIHCI